MFCPNCGKPVKENDNFCRYCGYSLTAEQEFSQPNEPVVEQANIENEYVVHHYNQHPEPIEPEYELPSEDSEELVIYDVKKHWMALFWPIFLTPVFFLYFWFIFLNTHSFLSWIIVFRKQQWVELWTMEWFHSHQTVNSLITVILRNQVNFNI